MIHAFHSRARVLLMALGAAGLAAGPAVGGVDPEKATQVFAEAKAICDRDAGALWGRTICGPMLLVDPADRSVVANQADAGGVLKPSGAVFIGVLPQQVIIASTPTEWSGTRWTQIVWPLAADTPDGRTTIAHELFHRIQPELKLSRDNVENQHLDTLEGRYLMQLEWRALAKALAAPTAAARRAAAADALLFRRERYRLFPGAAADEAALEIQEGIPEYTGVRLGLATPQARVSYAVHDLSAFVEAPTFVRSFAYALGPAYGLLLDEADPAWRGKLGSGRRLDELLGAALRLPEPAFDKLKAREAAYDDGGLRVSEVKRDQERQARFAALEARLVGGPVLTAPLAHANYGFNPRTLSPLGKFGTVYPKMRVSSDWGVLDVQDGGALMDSGGTKVSVSAAGVDPSGLTGPGWRLSLNKGWVVAAGPRKGDLVVQPTAAAAP